MRWKSQQLESKQFVSSRQKSSGKKLDAKFKSVNIFDILRKVEEMNKCENRHFWRDKLSKVQQNNIDPEPTRSERTRGKFFNLQNETAETKIIRRKTFNIDRSLVRNESKVCKILHEFTKCKKGKRRLVKKKKQFR